MPAADASATTPSLRTTSTDPPCSSTGAETVAELLLGHGDAEVGQARKSAVGPAAPLERAKV